MKNPKIMALMAIKKDMSNENAKRYKKEKPVKDEMGDSGKPSLVIRIERLKGKK